MKQIFKFICCGNVDDGKSTLIGRILLDTGSVKNDQLDDAKKASIKNGTNTIELAMLLDGLLSEREQQITIDIAHRYFDWKDIRFHILDCPGHKQYTKNMAIAAAEVDTAVVVIDVTKGIQEQTKKHIDICSLFKIKNICVCLTKCDLIFNKQNVPNKKVIEKLTTDIENLFNKYSFKYSIIPVSAISGYNIDTVLHQLCLYANDCFEANKKNKNSIIHIQSVKLYKGRRYYYGREINKMNNTSKYTLYPANIPITISPTKIHGCFKVKENVDIAPGDCISNTHIIVNNKIKQKIIWFNKPTKNMLLKHGSKTANVIKCTDKIIELDNYILFNNIEDEKKNGFGILIDDISKKTIGCSIFIGNNTNLTYKNKPKIYFVSSSNCKQIENYINKLKYFAGSNTIILEINKLIKDRIIDKNNSLKSTYKLAKMINCQGYNVVISAQKK